MQRLLFFLAAACIFLAGCGQSEEPASSQSPNQTTVLGTVTAAAGNEVTLALGTQDETAVASSQGAPSGAPEDMAADMPEDMPADMDMAEAPGGRASGGRQPGIQLTPTGEEATYLIPVGTAVTMTMGEQVITTTFSQISAGQILRLTLEPNSTGAATVVGAEILGQGQTTSQ